MFVAKWRHAKPLIFNVNIEYSVTYVSKRQQKSGKLAVIFDTRPCYSEEVSASALFSNVNSGAGAGIA
mgnify:CR=1 FL=1